MTLARHCNSRIDLGKRQARPSNEGRAHRVVLCAVGRDYWLTTVTAAPLRERLTAYGVVALVFCTVTLQVPS